MELNKAQRFVALDMLSKRVAAAAKAAKQDLEQEMSAGDRKGVTFDLEGEEVTLGAATRTKPKAAWKVTDADALIEWAQANKPDYVGMVPRMHEWAEKTVLAQAKEHGAPITPDGEMIPGIEEVVGSSYVSAKPDPGAADAMARLVAAGVIRTADLLEIEAP